MGSPATAHTYRYAVETRGDVEADLGRFRQITDRTLGDIRGWTLNHNVSYRRVDSRPDFRVVLASPEVIDRASPVCSPRWSCQVGDQVLINDRRWRRTTRAWPLSRRAYRSYVINHELGHWLSLGHVNCPEPDSRAPVMMQQSKGLDGCEARAWPLYRERSRVARLRGIDGWPTPPPRAPCTIIGTNGDDRLEGAGRADVICGRGGDDVLVGGGGFDALRGSEGHDVLKGAALDDWIGAGRGSDLIRGGHGDDELHGHGGQDRAFGGPGADFLGGGAGPDTIHGRQDDDVLWGRRGPDDLQGGTGADELHGNWRDDFLGGGGGPDLLAGGRGADTAKAAAGGDRAVGHRGDDRIFGGRHDDFLSGRQGGDLLDGGAGEDRCEPGAGGDRIRNCGR